MKGRIRSSQLFRKDNVAFISNLAKIATIINYRFALKSLPTISRSTSLTWAHTPTKLHNKFGYQYSLSNKQYGEYDQNITLETSPYMILSIEISRYSLKLMRQRLTRSNNIAWNLMIKVRELAWCQIQPKHYHRHSDARLSQK